MYSFCVMSEKQGFWKRVLQRGGAFFSLVPLYDKTYRHTKEAIVLFILYGYFSLSIISGATILNLRSILGLLVPLLSSAYCLFLVKTLQNRTKNQIKWGWIIAYSMSLLSLYVSLSHLNQIIALLINLLFTIAWFDLGNYLRKNNHNTFNLPKKHF